MQKTSTPLEGALAWCVMVEVEADEGTNAYLLRFLSL
jgi:hypothetical protein